MLEKISFLLLKIDAKINKAIIATNIKIEYGPTKFEALLFLPL